MLYEGLIRLWSATISTQVGVMSQDWPTSPKHIGCFVAGGSSKGIGMSYAAGFGSIFPMARTGSYAGLWNDRPNAVGWIDRCRSQGFIKYLYLSMHYGFIRQSWIASAAFSRATILGLLGHRLWRPHQWWRQLPGRWEPGAAGDCR
jgi:hypothetical protein